MVKVMALTSRSGSWFGFKVGPGIAVAVLAGVHGIAQVGPGGWALGLNSALPVQVEGRLIIPEAGADSEHSSLHYQLNPSQAAGRDPVSHVYLDLVTQPGAGWRGARVIAVPYDRRRTPFYVPVGYNTPPPIGQSRPATNLAYQWLAADLHALGWLTHRAAYYD